MTAAPEPDELLLTDDTDESRPRRVITARGVAIASARALTGVVGLGVAAATLTAAALLPLPDVRATPASTLVTPVPTAQQLVCAGGMLRLADDTGQGATVSSPLGDPELSAAASTGTLDTMVLPTSDAGSGGTPASPAVISIPPSDPDAGGPALLSGAQGQHVSVGSFVGLAAADCRGVSGDLWLAGGSTAVGRTTLLTIANPTEVPATVDLELFGERGTISAPGTRGIVVPAGGQRVISLAGYQPGVASPVVHVTSTGGQVVAHLQQSVLRVLEPGGLDVVGATRPPGLVSIIPGLRLTDAAAVEQLLGSGPDHLDTRTALRLFAPGEGQVSATVEVVADNADPHAAEPTVGTGEGHAHDHGTLRFEFRAGQVTDVLLEELETGSYTVRVTTDRPAVAAVRVTTTADGVSDFAWLAAAPELGARAQVTVAEGPAPVLHLANPRETDAEVTILGQALVVPGGGSITVPVDAGATVLIEASAPVHAAVTLAGGGAIAGYPVHPPGRGSTPIVVY